MADQNILDRTYLRGRRFYLAVRFRDWIAGVAVVVHLVPDPVHQGRGCVERVPADCQSGILAVRVTGLRRQA